MGDHHDGLAQLLGGPPHEGQDLGGGRGVQVAGGLVGEDDLGPAGQGPGHRHTLLLATGELGRPVLEPVRQADGADDPVEPALVGLPTRQHQRQRDVLDGVERRHEVERLEDEADAVPAQLRQLPLAEAGEVDVADVGRAGGQLVEAGHAVHQRRLARAGRAHDGAERTAAEPDGDVVEGSDLRVAVAVDLGRRLAACREPGEVRGTGLGGRSHGATLGDGSGRAGGGVPGPADGVESTMGAIIARGAGGAHQGVPAPIPQGPRCTLRDDPGGRGRATAIVWRPEVACSGRRSRS